MQLAFNNRFLKIIVSLAVVLIMFVMLLTPSYVYAGYQPHATNRNIMNKDSEGNPLPGLDDIYYYDDPWNEDGTFDYFHYPLYGDPMYISDEEMFGVWDETNMKWASYPSFRYSEFPEMSKVEEEAKKGNYDAAKEALVDYYLGVRYDRVRRLSSYLSESSRNKSDAYMEAMARNLYPDLMIASDYIGIAQTSSEWETVKMDVTRILNDAAGGYPQFNVLVASVDKFYTQAEIYSRQSEHPPVLKAKVNGVNVEFKCDKDAMIRAGIDSKTNYGFDEIIVIEEHGCYDTADKNYGSYDETTSRAFIDFDISSLKRTDKIENATIELYCRNTAPKDFKELSFLWYKDSSYTEDSINWDSFSEQHWFSCNDMEAWDYVTPSEANVKGKVCTWHRESGPNNLVTRFAAYKDERFAYNWLRHMLALINGIGCSPDVMNSLDMSTHVSGATESLYHCLDSEYMNGDILMAFLKHWILLTRHQLTVEFGRRDNNWATFATGAVYNLLARFPELTMHNEWLEAVKVENKRVLSDATFEDGLCIELGLAYVRTILSTYATPINTTLATGEELPYDDEIMTDIYNSVMTLVNSRGPYYGFNLADSYDTYDKNTLISTLKTWYNFGIFDDDHLTYLATNGAKGALPANPTTRYYEAQRTYMRSGWGQNDLMLSFTNNVMVKGSHGHKDALSITLFAYGKSLLVDPGYGGILTGDLREYNMSPVQHNLVTVNDYKDWLNDGTLSSSTTLLEGDGIELAYEANMQYDFTEYATKMFTTTDLSQRSVTFVRDDNFWIVTDYHIPEDATAKNVFAQHWHLYPGAKFDYNEDYVISSNFDDVNIKIVPVEYEEIDDVKRVGTYYSEEEGQMLNSEKAMIMKMKSGTGRFTTILVPENIGEDLSVLTATFDSGIEADLVNATYFTIVNNKTGEKKSYYFYHLNDESKKQEAKVGKYYTDATTLLIKQNSSEEIVSVFMMNGTYLKDSELPNEYVIKSNIMIPSLSYNVSTENIRVATTYLAEEDMKNITLYSHGVDSVYFSPIGSTLKAGKKGGYFYFGDEPMIDAEDTEENEEKEDTNSGDREQGVSGRPPVSSGGGGSSKPVKPEDEITDEPKPIEPTPVEPATPSFDDVKDTDWFFEYVEELYENGIVSGDEKGNFNPNDNVTREQFLKMLVEAADIEAEETENTFADVKDLWYKPYVLKAKNFGIVNGISDTEFGIGSNITRQDMAVMITRTIEKLDMEIKAEDVSEFADNSNVSDYAKDAVTFMKSIGLIEGYNNEYRPLDNLTRAEAATIIARFIMNFEI